MDEQQANWAAQHDWFVNAWQKAGDWIVCAREVVRAQGGKVSENQKEFSDFRELREWAGY